MSSNAAKFQPIVVGIDLGHDCTKVAVSLPQNGRYPTQPTQLEFQAKPQCNILPTVITYQRFQTVIGCNLPTTSDDSSETYRWFKLAALSSHNKEDPPILSVSGKTEKPARQLLGSFLLCLSLKVRHCMAAIYPRLSSTWDTENIDFVLSVPSIVGAGGAAILTKLAKENNFESADGKHRVVEIALTEPEAAASWVARRLACHIGLKKGHTALVLDIGGGTSDLSMMTVMEDDGWKLDTNFLQPVSSQRLGGAHMDRAVLESVENLFLQHVGRSDDLATCLGEITSTPDYFKAKTEPTELEYTLGGMEWNGILSMIDGDIADAGDKIRVSRNRLVVDKCVFESKLDEQVFGTEERRESIVDQVITMCDDLFVCCPGRSSQYCKDNSLEENHDLKEVALDFLIFTGGLSRSRRLQNNVETAVKASADRVGPTVGHIVKDTKFVKWDEESRVDPQLLVCKGLVRYHTDGMQRAGGQSRFVYKTWLRTLLSRK